MPDFLDRFGDQLYAAHDPSRSRRFSWRGPRRHWLLVLAAVLVVAGPAVAVVGAWRPALERSGIDQPVTVDSSPVSPAALDALAVLRRPQTDEDRRRAAPLIPTVGAGNQIDRVQTDGIRSPANGWALVPATSIKSGPATTTTDVLCLTDGQAIGCSPATSIRTQGLALLSASRSHTSLAGVVPDGVAKVRFIPDTGAPVEADVASNFFSLSVAQTAPSRTVKAPPGSNGPSRIPGPPMPVRGTVQWLNRHGVVIGPAERFSAQR